MQLHENTIKIATFNYQSRQSNPTNPKTTNKQEWQVNLTKKQIMHPHRKKEKENDKNKFTI